MTKKINKPKLKDFERYCPKCKIIVHKSEFNGYYGICHACVDGKRS